MQITEKAIAKVTVLTPQENRIDATVATAFKGRIVDLINQGATTIALDLSLVEFMDSSGLTSVISALKTVNLSGGKMAVCNLTPGVLKLFQLTKLDKVFAVYPDQDKACLALENPDRK